MSNSKKKLILCGVDQALPYLLDLFLEKGSLPNIANIVNNGVKGIAYSCPPCDTPTNWTTIATGATTAIHGATSFYIHIPGEPFEEGLEKRSRSQLSKYCTAEYLWDVADNSDYLPYVVNYPSGWPSHFKNGAMTALVWPIPGTLPKLVKSESKHTIPLELVDDSEKLQKVYPSLNVSEKSLEVLGFKLNLKLVTVIGEKIFQGYVSHQKIGNPNNSIILEILEAPNPVEISIGEWTDWLSSSFDTEHGPLPCFFKLRALEMDYKQSLLTMECSVIYNSKGWTVPDSFGAEIIKNVLNIEFHSKHEKFEYMISGDVQDYLKRAKNEVSSVGNVIAYAHFKLNWEVCFFHLHLLDSINHKELSFLHRSSPMFSEDRQEKALENIESAYKLVDELIGFLQEKCIDDNTIIVFVADHGAMPSWKVANIPLALIKSGLLVYKWKSFDRKYFVNWRKTKAFPYLEPLFIWVNLKGRDPNGIVTQSDYESVRDEIIDTLYNLRDPQNGNKIVKLALKREDAAFLGLDGHRIGDVVYFLNPPYQIYDENFEQMNPSFINPKYMAFPEVYPAKRAFGAHVYYFPTENFGNFGNSVPLIMSGPGIEKGITLKREVNLVDLAPTLSYLLNIPKPKDSVGRVLHEIIN